MLDADGNEIPQNAAPVPQEAIQLLVSDSYELRAIKSWNILGGQGPVNPVFKQIFEVYNVLDRQHAAQEFEKAAAVGGRAPDLMAS